ILCTLPVLAVHAAPIKANTPAATTAAATVPPDTRPADILIFPKGKAEVSIPFTLVDGVPVTSAVRVNGKFLGRFVIDTGAQETFISRALANHYHLPVALKLHITCKRCRVDVRRVKRLQVGAITLVDDSINTEGLAKVKDPMVKTIIGSIGGDILGRMPFAVDYRDSKVIFYNPKSFQPPQMAAAFPIEIFWGAAKTKDGILASRLFTWMGVPTLAGTLNGKPIRWCPDTGTTVPVALMPMFVHDHPELVNRQCFLMNTRGFQLQGQAFRATHTTIGILGKKIHNIGHIYTIVAKPWQLEREKFSDLDILVGGRFLRKYRLTFDYAAKKIWVQRNPPLSYQAQLADGLNPNHADLAGETPLMHAAFHNDLAGVKALLHAGANPLAKDKSGLTVLDYATMGGNSKIIKLLLAGPARKDVNYSGAFWTPLTYAVEHKDDQAAWRELVSIGATVNPGPDPAYTPLLAAVRYDNINADRWLINHGANVNGADKSGQTPLIIAAWSGNFIALKLLRAHGAKLHAREMRGDTPLFNAAQGGHVSMIKFLLSRAGGSHHVNSQDSLGQTPLMVAAAYGHFKATRFLLSSGARVNLTAKGRGNQTALFFAAQHEQPKELELLIKHGAKLDARNSMGETPLMAAAQMANMRDMDVLLKSGADANSCGLKGVSTLTFAAASGCWKPVELLLSHGAKTNVADNSGLTPLMAAAAENGPTAVGALIKAGAKVNARAAGYLDIAALEEAAGSGNPSVIELLIRHGAKLNATDSFGRTPLTVAALQGHARAVRALIKAGANIHIRSLNSHLGVVGLAVSHNHPKIIPMLIRHGAKVDQRYALRRTPLMLAASKGFLACVQVLLKAGADVNAQDDNGYTPLEAAASDSQLKIAKVIIHAGANVNLADHYGMTPLDYACLAKHPSAMVALLLKAGANPKLKDKKGRNALYYARKSGSAKAVALVQAVIGKTTAPPASRKQATK
ncbi:MAG: ankyrin repeat domain-containing protein, partial [Phycisphaerae bacterium]